MVSYNIYNNTLPYTQKHPADMEIGPAGISSPYIQPWQWTANYRPERPNHQFLGEMDPAHAHHHQMYYTPHMFHTTAGAASEWHSPTSSADNYAQNVPPTAAHQMLHHHHHHTNNVGHNHNNQNNNNVNNNNGGSSSSASSSSASIGPTAGNNRQLNETASSLGEQHIAEGLPSPPITVSGSEISSPGAPVSSSSPHHTTHHLSNHNNNNNNSPSASNNNNNSAVHNNNNHRASPVKAQYYDWMKKPSYPAQPTPGKTRTKDKYRVVYTDFQRLELEKEYCTSRYITIRRKTELAQSLSLSERQVKIWFQNRRAKERKQSKKGTDSNVMGGVQHSDYANLMDTKPKLEPGIHLQHSLHSMNSMAAMGMSSLHHHLHNHHQQLAHSHVQLHQSPHAQMSAAAAVASVGSLAM